MMTKCVQRLDLVLNEMNELQNRSADMPDYASLLISYLRDFVEEVKALHEVTYSKGTEKDGSLNPVYQERVDDRVKKFVQHTLP